MLNSKRQGLIWKLCVLFVTFLAINLYAHPDIYDLIVVESHGGGVKSPPKRVRVIMKTANIHKVRCALVSSVSSSNMCGFDFRFNCYKDNKLVASWAINTDCEDSHTVKILTPFLPTMDDYVTSYPLFIGNGISVDSLRKTLPNRVFLLTDKTVYTLYPMIHFYLSRKVECSDPRELDSCRVFLREEKKAWNKAWREFYKDVKHHPKFIAGDSFFGGSSGSDRHYAAKYNVKAWVREDYLVFQKEYEDKYPELVDSSTVKIENGYWVRCVSPNELVPDSIPKPSMRIGNSLYLPPRSNYP